MAAVQRQKSGRSMAEPILRFPADAPKRPAGVALGLLARLKQRRRFVLLVLIPAIASIAVLSIYLSGGRYVTTDNAYVGAQKILITPDISGKIGKVTVREGDRVKS